MKRFDQAWLVAKRELIDQMRDWRILLPMIILTLFFPYLMNVAAKSTVTYVNQYGANLIAERLLPFLILVVGYFPVTVSLVVALEAFVGEKERGTIEPLLTSPLADEHLYLGKLMAGTIVPLTVSYIGIALYMGGLLWQGIKWPEWGFIAQTLALTAVQTLLMVSAAIVISTQSTTVRAANLLASFIVIPVALLIQGESALMFWGTNDVLWLAVLGVAIMSALIIRLGIVHFKRESLLGREIDMLNLGWVWQTFRKALTGTDQPSGLTRYLVSAWKRRRGEEAETFSFREALWLDWNGILRWYREDVALSLRRLAPSFWITLGIGLIAVLAAYLYVDSSLPVAATLSDETLEQSLKTIRAFLVEGDSIGISTGMLFWHNLRAELVIMALGAFSFGVLSIVVYVANFALIGAVLGAVRIVGISPWLIFVSGILPHGIVELPSIILLSAAVFHMGLRLVTPEEGHSIGETMIITFADVIKILLAVCIPLLIIAALIEANITPRLLIATIGRSLDLKP
ncbi:MAG: stage II sporulation protein M [Chloroflexi bacterium]|nr:stage II sporulation protein M [Chloroflexota bacterium]